MSNGTIFGELINFGKDTFDVSGDVLDGLIDSKPNSIARQAKQGILYFTTIASSSISLDEASMANKCIEREQVAFLTIVFSQNIITDAKNINEYLKRIHANSLFESTFYFTPISKLNKTIEVLKENETLAESTIREQMSGLDRYLKVGYDDIDTAEAKRDIDAILATKVSQGKNVCKSPYCDSIIVQDSDNSMSQLTLLQDSDTDKIMVVETKVYDIKGSNPINESALDRAMSSMLQEGLSPYVPEFNLKVLNEMCGNHHSFKIIGDEILQHKYKEQYLKEDAGDDIERAMNKAIGDQDEVNAKINQLKKDREGNINSSENAGLRKLHEIRRKNAMRNAGEKASVDAAKSKAREANARADKAQLDLETYKNKSKEGANYDFDDRYSNTVCKDILKDSDVKKPNELVPTLMHIKVYFRDKKTATVTPIDFMVGVKSVLHVMRTDLMTEYIPRSLKNDNKLLRFIKLTSGEISFLKDFVFGLDKVKDNVKTKLSGNKWADAFSYRKKNARGIKLLTKQNLAANGTIILSMDEVEKMRVDNKIDLMNPSTAKTIMKNLYLLGLVVLDSSVETGYFFFDGMDEYQTHSYRSLERENANSEKDMKNILKLAGKL